MEAHICIIKMKETTNNERVIIDWSRKVFYEDTQHHNLGYLDRSCKPCSPIALPCYCGDVEGRVRRMNANTEKLRMIESQLISRKVYVGRPEVEMRPK